MDGLCTTFTDLKRKVVIRLIKVSIEVCLFTI